MAKLIRKMRLFLATPIGAFFEAVIYAVMLILIMAFFTGNAQFIYEAF